MKSSRCLIIALMLLVGMSAQATADDPRSADHDQLRALMQRAREAVNSQDVDTLATLLAPGFAVTMADQTTVTDLAGLKGYFQRLFRGEDAILESVHIEPEADIRTQFIDGHTGINYGHSTDTYTLPGGQQLTLQSRWTATVVKLGDEWKVQAFHAGVNMVDNPILTAAKRLGYLWGAGGLAVGLVAGALLRRRRRG